MKVLIIEDELPACKNLISLLNEISEEITIVGTVASIQEGIHFFSTPKEIDLIFSDIQLSDGTSFELFRNSPPTAPIIFTTAFDQYAIDAFKLHSVDYLLKPLDSEELSASISKFRHLHFQKESKSNHSIEKLLEELKPSNSIHTLLVYQKNSLIPLAANDVSYFNIEDGKVRANSKQGYYQVEQTLDNLEKQLDPHQFYRANRQFIINRNSITQLEPYFQSKLIIHLDLSSDSAIIVSKEKARNFKNWIVST